MVVQRLLLAGVLALCTSGAQAALKICNETTFVQGVSIGYQGEDDWTSEGWWNIKPGTCATPITGDLTRRYVYYRAEVDGGDFTGQNYFFCTSPSEYTIVGDADCVARGYDREDFREVDVGAGNTDFTLTLVADAADATETTSPEIPAQTSDLGFRICNDTSLVQGVSVGYKGNEDWTSEGWWNIQPKACATVVAGELKQRYYYYRAEVDGGPFDHGTFNFCTTPREYTIIGDQDCEARGYVTEAFAEVDTGGTAKGYTLTLVGDATDTPAPTVAGGLTLCNETALAQAVAIGYEGPEGWMSKGWWNIGPSDCAKVLSTALSEQHYYYRAEVPGGDFLGQGNFFCTTPEAFEISGDADCEARGYEQEDFAEINVGLGVTEFTFNIAGSAVETGNDTATPPATAAGGGLRICNETAQVQGVSVGYQDAEDNWTSEGWWNLQPQGCATVIAGELQKRYYYYRAEVDGGPFDGGGYTFCTSPSEYTIVGDTDCDARGYDTEDFAEIDTGPTAKSFVFTLVAADGAMAGPEPELFEEDATEGISQPDAVAEPEAVPKPAPPPAPAPEVIPVPEAVPAPEEDPDPMAEPDAEPEPEPLEQISPRRGGSRGG